jgi:enoyl-CoA hydratase
VTDVLTHIDGRAGRIRLNRPSAIHALTPAMIADMTDALLAWRDDPAVECVLVDHAEGRGFCSGGDIRLLSESAKADGREGRAFFHAEYRLNHLMFTYPKPIVAFMDGITMGGGVGISQPARYRVATENTRYAMPESGIGLFPDVGGGWYLSRLPGRIGAFLATTGARLDGAECAAIGLATHYLPAETLADAKARIAGGADIAATLSALAIAPPDARILANREKIDRLFASDRLEDIIAALDADGSDWAAKERATLATKSPQTCKVALRQLRESLQLDDFADNMRMEYRLAARVMMLPDFTEGVRAVIVDKDNAPRWNPVRPEDVTEAIVDAIFAPLPPQEEWTPL